MNNVSKIRTKNICEKYYYSTIVKNISVVMSRIVIVRLHNLILLIVDRFIAAAK